MKGSRIIIASNMRGVVESCYINGTPQPGTVMELDAAVEPVGNLFTWQPYGTTAASGGNGVTNDGDRKVIAVLLEKDDEGLSYDDAYADGDMGRVYFPVMGEELNMLVENQPGTADSFAIGDELMVDDGTGKLLACDNNAENHPFTCRETLSALTADAWVRCQYNGSAG